MDIPFYRLISVHDIVTMKFNQGIRESMMEEQGSIRHMTPNELIAAINSLDGINVLRDRALVSLLYLTACRVEEVVNYIHEIREKKVKSLDKFGRPIILKERCITERRYIGEPIKRKDIIVSEYDSKRIEIHNVKILKKKLNTRSKYKTRIVPVYINDLEKPFVKMLFDYLNTLNDEEDMLFPLTRQRVFQILQKIGIFPHLLRHTRLSHLSIYYNFNPSYLREMTGWSSTKPADVYVHLNKDDLFDAFERRFKK